MKFLIQFYHSKLSSIQAKTMRHNPFITFLLEKKWRSPRNSGSWDENNNPLGRGKWSFATVKTLAKANLEHIKWHGSNPNLSVSPWITKRLRNEVTNKQQTWFVLSWMCLTTIEWEWSMIRIDIAFHSSRSIFWQCNSVKHCDLIIFYTRSDLSKIVGVDIHSRPLCVPRLSLILFECISRCYPSTGDAWDQLKDSNTKCKADQTRSSVKCFYVHHIMPTLSHQTPSQSTHGLLGFKPSPILPPDLSVFFLSVGKLVRACLLTPAAYKLYNTKLSHWLW